MKNKLNISKHAFLKCLLLSLSLLIISYQSPAQQYFTADWGRYLKEGVTNFDLPYEEMAEAIAVDQVNGDTYVAGRTKSECYSAGSYALCSGGTGVAFLAHYTKAGLLKWVKFIGDDDSGISGTDNSYFCTNNSPHGYSEWPYCIAIDHTATGKAIIYVGGEIMGASTSAYTAGVSGAITTPGDDWDGFLAKFNATGTLQDFTFLGGTSAGGTCTGACNTKPTIDEVLGITVNPNHHVFITGYTESPNVGALAANTHYPFNCPSTKGGDCFLAELSSTLTSFTHVEYIGGTKNDRGHSIVLSEESGTEYIIVSGTVNSSSLHNITPLNTIASSQDAFLVKRSVSGFEADNLLTTGEWFTFIGGNDLERGRGVDVNPNSPYDIYTTGWTQSTNLPTSFCSFQCQKANTSTNEVDAYVAKYSSSGSLTWITYFGGDDDDKPNSLKFYNDGSSVTDNHVFVSGTTTSRSDITRNFPLAPGSSPFDVLQCSLDGGNTNNVEDAFVFELDDFDPGACTATFCTPTQTLSYSSYLGSSDDEYLTPQGSGDIIFNSYGPTLDLYLVTGALNSVFVAFTTKGNSATNPMQFPITGGNINASANNTNGDAFTVRLKNSANATNFNCTPLRIGHFDDAMSAGVSVFPNPANDMLNVNITGAENQTGILQVYNSLGQLVVQQAISIESEEQTFSVDLNSLPQGMFLLQVHCNNEETNLEFIKE